MTYCINPNCKNPQNPNSRLFCCSCGSELLLEGRYQVVQLLEKRPYTAIYEVTEEGQEKILKVLEKPYSKLVELFEKEAKVLLTLNHPGIPKRFGYFQFKVKDKAELFPCLVMEKIQGVNLQKYIEQRENRPIQEELAVQWLIKLGNILDAVHENKLFHRDIKPSNIMLKHDGEVVLIDFGAVREITDTYPVSLAKENITTVSSQGYTAPEQHQAQAVPPSDFFALGRTFVYLLTGVEPHSLKDPNNKDRLIWRKKADVSSFLADFLDKLMEPSPEKRPKDTKNILQELAEIQEYFLATRPISSDIDIPENQIYENCNNRSTQQTLPLKGKADTKKAVISFLNPVLKKKLIKHIMVAVITGVTAILLNPNLIKSTNIMSGSLQPEQNHVLIGDHLSDGEEILIPESEIQEKKTGIEAYREGQYEKAISWLQKARQKRPEDPEVLIYLNNARIEAKKVNAYTIAVAAPISSNPDTGVEILRGVAHAQNTLMRDRKNNSNIALKVLIADDANDNFQAKKIANALVSQPKILAVVGHYASEITLATRDIYENQKLVQVSPGSTSAYLPRSEDRFFFRTVATERKNTQRMTSYLMEMGQKKVAVFYAPQSNYSRSAKEQFTASFSGSGRQIVTIFDLSDPFFKADDALSEVQKQGATALVVIPDGGTSRSSFPNAIRLIQTNQSRFLVVGLTSLANRDVLLLGKEALARLVITTPWMETTSPNQEFPKEAKNLWKRGEVTWRTATAYDATQALIKALEITPNPTRQKLQATLSKDDFKAWGATGVISFLHDGSLLGDRKEDLVQSAKVIRSQCSNSSPIFVPLEYEQNYACPKSVKARNP